MRRQHKRAVCAAFALATLACASDPTSELRTGPTILSITPTVAFLDPAATVAVVVVARDDQLNPVPVTITATSGNSAVATVEVDTARHFPDGATQAFIATGVTPGQTTLTVTGSGLTGTVTVNVVPVVFNGALSSATPAGGDTLKISATPLLKFDPAQRHRHLRGGRAGHHRLCERGFHQGPHAILRSRCPDDRGSRDDVHSGARGRHCPPVCR